MLMGKLTDHWWTVLIGMAGFYFGCKLFGWLAKAKS